MSSRGKGGDGLGKGGAKRHREALRGNSQGITKPFIRRLARRSGVGRMSVVIHKGTQGVLKMLLQNIISNAPTSAEYMERKTVTAVDVTR
ncbi:Histone H4 [Taenia solium]|eukprot:TsM_000549300 transcript=TsM_000549300 gene=TsM_000549300